MSILTAKKRIRSFHKKIELYGLLGAIALLFLAPGCSKGSSNDNSNDNVQALYGAAVFTCTEDADCVEEYGEGYVCTDSECVEPNVVYGPPS